MTIPAKADPTLYHRLQRIAVWMMAAVILTGIVVLLAWAWKIDFLIRPIWGLAAMNPVTALCFLVLGSSFLVLANPNRSSKIQGWAWIPVGAVLFIALLRLSAVFISPLQQIDQWLFARHIELDAHRHPPDKMAVNTAFCFICCSVALLMLRLRPSINRLPIHLPVLLTMSIALLSVIGYIYHVKEFYSVLRYVPMAIHTAICFLLFCIAFLFVTPDRGIMHDLMGTGTGSITARMLIPYAFAVPILLGFLRLLGAWRGLFTVEFGVSILVLSIILCFVFIIWYNAVLLNKRDRLQSEAQEALRASEQRFSVLVGSIKDYAIFMIDPDGHIMSWNEGAQTIKGYTAGEIMGRHISTFYTPEEIAQDEPAHNLEMARINGHYNRAGWRLRKDGSRFWADIVFTAIYDQDHRLQGYAKITKDITEQKKIEEKITYQARLMEDSNDAIFSIDTSFVIVTWNKAAETLYGFSAEEAIGKRTQDLLQYPTGSTERELRRKEVIEKGHWKGETTHLRKSGSPVHLLVSASAIRDPEGQVEGYVLVCRDITERKAAEEQLQKFNEDLAGQVRKKTKELASVFDRLSEGFMAIDKTGLITYANRKAAEINKRHVGDLVGKNIWQTFPGAIKSPFGEQFRHALVHQEDRHFEVFSESILRWMACDIYPSEEGVSFFFRDITEQRNAQEAIYKSHAELRALASHLQDIREEERATIAREIHDELGQQLTGLKMDLSWICKRLVPLDQDAIIQRANGAMELLNHTIQTVRKLATDLRPSILDDLGLVAAMEWLCQEFQKRSGILTLIHTSEARLDCPSKIAIGLFRICQEALTNVARHSDASTVRIYLERESEQMTLKVSDDGKGLDIDTAQRLPKKTLGLVGIKERALMMRGVVNFQSKPGKGLTLTVTVPLQIEDN